jgi:hypothetical protein
MVQAFKEHVIVGPSGRVLIDRTSLPEGTRAEVIVLVDPAGVGTPAPVYFSDLIGRAQGSFASAEEADVFIRQQRDEWDRE